MSVFIMLICPLTTLLTALIFVRICLSVTTVCGHSMHPTLAPGDRLLVLHHWPGKWLCKGLIVVGHLDKVLPSLVLESFNPPEMSKFIKRVIGLPGDTVVIHISELHEMMRPSLQPRCDSEGNLVWHIPPGHCFVRGDGPISGDSATWGPVPLDAITGVVLAKLPRRAGFSQTESPLPDYPSPSQPEFARSEKDR
jgi:signal peptidase I